MTAVQAAAIAVAALVLVLAVRLGWWWWDHVRDRGEIVNPLAGGTRVRIATTRELRLAKRQHPPTPTPVWVPLELMAPVEGGTNSLIPFVEEGREVVLCDADRVKWTAKIVARAARWTSGIGLHYDYLGEIALPVPHPPLDERYRAIGVPEEAPFRIAFTHDKIWSVVPLSSEQKG